MDFSRLLRGLRGTRAQLLLEISSYQTSLAWQCPKHRPAQSELRRHDVDCHSPPSAYRSSKSLREEPRVWVFLCHHHYHRLAGVVLHRGRPFPVGMYICSIVRRVSFQNRVVVHPVMTTRLWSPCWKVSVAAKCRRRPEADVGSCIGHSSYHPWGRVSLPRCRLPATSTGNLPRRETFPLWGPIDL